MLINCGNESAGIQCDILIIGGGMAAVAAAISAAESGVKPILAMNGRFTFSGSSFYPNSLPWGIATVGNGENGAEHFFEEIVRASSGCLDKPLTRVLAEQSEEVYQKMVQQGMVFIDHADSGDVPCFGTVKRGYQLENLESARYACKKKVQELGIRILEHMMAYELMIKDGCCCGAAFLSGKERVCIHAKAVVIATGGAEGVYHRSFFVGNHTMGSGYAMALSAGAKLVNMEFVQFINGLTDPVPGLNFHQFTFSSQPQILTEEGESVLCGILPDDISEQQCLAARGTHGPFSSEDCSKWLDIAMSKRQKDPACPQGFRVIYGDAYWKEPSYQIWTDYLQKRKIDFVKNPFRIYPHAQAWNGGIEVNLDAETDIPGLFACGEAAGGMHGANRMGGNAILETQVFGRKAGISAAQYAKRMKSVETDNGCPSLLDNGVQNKLSSKEVLEQLRQIMQRGAAIIRTEESLKEADKALDELWKQYNPAAELLNEERIAAFHGILSAKAMVAAMAVRKESRGSHYREDYPEKREGYEKIVFNISQRDMQIQINQRYTLE